VNGSWASGRVRRIVRLEVLDFREWCLKVEGDVDNEFTLPTCGCVRYKLWEFIWYKKHLQRTINTTDAQRCRGIFCEVWCDENKEKERSSKPCVTPWLTGPANAICSTITLFLPHNSGKSHQKPPVADSWKPLWVIVYSDSYEVPRISRMSPARTLRTLLPTKARSSQMWTEYPVWFW
jgi:hypothetical protein